jgi:Predicted membrane protein
MTQHINKQGRLQWVDYARGLAIMLVVYRHVVIGVTRTGLDITPAMFNIQEVFFNFRMPVFFVLSGIFLAGSLARKSIGTVLKDRTTTLLYTYLLWGGITIILFIYFSRYTNTVRHWSDLTDLVVKPREVGHLWYLLALFNTSALYLLMKKLKLPHLAHIILAALMYWFARVPFVEQVSAISDLCYYYLYFLTGTYVSSVILDAEKGPAVLSSKKLLWLVPLFIAGQTFWYLNREERGDLFSVSFLIINMVACYFMYVISNLLSGYKSNYWIAYLGKYSLYIYILHVYVASVTRSLMLHFAPGINIWVLVITCWVAGMIVPVFLYNLLKGVGVEKLFSLKTKSVA